MTPIQLIVAVVTIAILLICNIRLYLKNMELEDEVAYQKAESSTRWDKINRLETDLDDCQEKMLAIRMERDKQTDSYEVQELLHDLTAGKALVEIRRIAPTSFFLRSPKERD